MDRIQTFMTVCFMAFALPSAAWAGNYSINPTRVTLTESQPSTMLTLVNRGDDELRFQVSAFSWSQSDSGQMEFEPTDDLVVYPTLFTVAPGQQRMLRIGTTEAFGSAEATYRLYINELPPLEEDTGQVGVRVLARMGVPIFLAPTRAHVSGEIDEVSLDGDLLSLSVLNDGNVHVMLQDVSVTALDARGRALWDRHRSDWYLLADDRRELRIELPHESCDSVRSLDLKVVTDRATWRQSVEVGEGICLP